MYVFVVGFISCMMLRSRMFEVLIFVDLIAHLVAVSRILISNEMSLSSFPTAVFQLKKLSNL